MKGIIKERIDSITRLVFSLTVFFFIAIPLVIYMKKSSLGFAITGYGKSFSYLFLDFFASGIQVLIIFIIYRKIFVDGFKNFKFNINNVFEYVMKILSFFGIFILASAFLGFVSETLAKLFGTIVETGSNQATLEEMGLLSPVLIAISAIIFAPISEELLFRGGIRQVLKNKKVFIAVSGLIFGVMHVTDSISALLIIIAIGIIVDIILEKKNINKDNLSVNALSVIAIICLFVAGFFLAYLTTNDINEGLNSFTYVSAGILFASIYAKTDNITYTICLHMLINSLAVRAMLTL